jgi:hypothetical protein
MLLFGRAAARTLIRSSPRTRESGVRDQESGIRNQEQLIMLLFGRAAARTLIRSSPRTRGSSSKRNAVRFCSGSPPSRGRAEKSARCRACGGVMMRAHACSAIPLPPRSGGEGLGVGAISYALSPLFPPPPTPPRHESIGPRFARSRWPRVGRGAAEACPGMTERKSNDPG